MGRRSPPAIVPLPGRGWQELREETAPPETDREIKELTE
jgi:hypothetical protein